MAAIGAIARFKCRPKKADEVRRLLLDVCAEVRQEAGNVHYDVYRTRAEPDELIVLERYLDRDAVRAHAGADYVKAFGEAVRPLLAAEMSVEILQGQD